MNSRILAIVVLLALGLPALYWLTSTDGVQAPLVGQEAQDDGASDAGEPLPAIDGATAMVEPEASSSEARSALEPEVDLVETQTWPEEKTRWLDLQLIMPPGTPLEEKAQVLALSSAGDHEDVYGEDGPVRQLDGVENPLKIDGVLGAASVNPDGSGRIGLGPDTDEVWLAVSGLYVYSLDLTHVDLGALSGPVELRPILGARISGRLLPAAGQPAIDLTQVEVELGWSINAALQLGTAGAADLDLTMASDADGRFEFRSVPVGKPQTISTSDSSPVARVFHEDLKPSAGDHLQVELEVGWGATIRGRVVDEQGNPIAEVEVAAVGRELLGNPTEELRDSESDADGKFELAAITPGKVWLRLKHDEYQLLLTSAFELADREIRNHEDLTLTEGLAVSGKVLFPDGSAAVEARVQVQPDLSENLAGSPVDPHSYIGARNDSTTDEAGAFRIKGLGPGPWIVTAEIELDDPDGTRTVGTWNGNQSLVRAPADAVDVNLEAPITVNGIVLDGQQLPITKFSIRGERAGSQWYMPPSDTREETFTSEDGRFALTGLRSGDWSFTSSGAEYARSAEVPLALPSDEELTFTLLRPVRLTGSVVDPEGQPVAGAEVSKELEGTEVIEAMQGRGDWPVASSDDTGNFALEGLLPGAGSVLAKKSGFAPSAAIAYELAEGEEKADIVLTLRRGGAISGEVYNAGGERSANCLIILQMPTLAERRFTNTDADGEFLERGLTPGTWQVQAFPGIASLQSESGEALDQATLLAALKMTAVELEDEAEEHVVLGAPPEDPVRVHGLVTLDREPIESSIISFVPAGGGGLEMLKIEPIGDDGRYSLQLDEPGEYLVTIQTTGTPGRQNSIEFRRRIPKGEAFELHFELPLGRVSGRVVGPDGDPVAGARMTITLQGGMVFGTVFGGQYTEAATDADGEYEIAYLRPGSYSVGAGGSPLGGFLGTTGELGRQIRTIDVEENEWIRGVDFELVEPGSLHGTVRDSSGGLVAHAAIFVRNEDGHLLEKFSLSETNASGSFEYSGLAPGDYTVAARSSTLASARGIPVTVRSGESTETTIAVGPGTMLLVTLTDKTGSDIPSRVSVMDSKDREMNGMLGLAKIMERYSGGLNNTVQQVGPLPPGSYKVRAVAEDGRSTVRPVNLTGQAERKVKLRLK